MVTGMTRRRGGFPGMSIPAAPTARFAGMPRNVGPSLAAALLAAASAAGQAPGLWSLVPPAAVAVPEVQASSWPRNAVDRFVLARLLAADLQPSAAADPATLLRRVTLDLTGLPPTPEELADFAADPSDANYERVVDRLLASVAHGERMAQLWLDLARYSDTNGYDFDSDRQMWAWRDWVVEAFAAGMPYDQFTLAQIAGDLLPGATLAQRIATGFHRNHAIAMQIDGQPGELHHQYVADRTATFATTWLGLSVGCAECHDHKFDPISQRDYYGLYAFWNRMPERGLEQAGNAAPFLRLPTAEQGARLLELQQEEAELTQRLRRELQGREAAFAAFRAGRATSAAVSDGLWWHEPLDGPRPGETELGGIGAGGWVGGLRGGAVHFDGNDTCVRLHRAVELRADAPFTIAAWIRLADGTPTPAMAIVGKVDEAAEGRGWEVTVADRRLAVALVGGKDDRLGVRARDELELGVWYHVAAVYDGSRRRDGLRLFVDGAPAELAMPPAPPADAAAAATSPKPPKNLVGDLGNDGAMRIGSLDGRPFLGAIDEVRIYGRALDAAGLAAAGDADLAAAGLFAEPAPVAHRQLLERTFVRRGDAALVAIETARLAVAAEHRRVLDEVAMVSVAAEMSEPRATHLLLRGDYQSPAERIEPALPAAFGALPAEAPRNRLGLARWLVAADNPLVARVHVNRIWAMLFGRGLVATLDDFGTQGAPPSHPELLDWLARDFVAHGFAHRHLVKQLVLSSTYRQSTQAVAAQQEADPENRLLGRAVRWRLDAEALRDQALQVAGLLDRKVEGPAVMPWQPADLWPEPSAVAQRYRRGLYVAQKRSVPFVTFRLFDAPGREICVAQRHRTTTPLQALALFNDRNFAEAARAFAQRLLGRGGDDAARLRRGFLLAVQREPDEGELAILGQLLVTQRALFLADPAAAAAAVEVGDAPKLEGQPAAEIAAWAAVAAVLLNLEEILVRP